MMDEELPMAKPKGKIVADPEIQAMAEISAILEPLDARAHWRVLRYIGDRYGIEYMEDMYAPPGFSLDKKLDVEY